jgi:DNA repair protein RecN (Recombination protein N)
MLRELRVQNFALIDRVELEFLVGLNILSGETGAGKSILLKSLGLLMGAKADPDVVGPRADTAAVEGLFDLSRRLDVVDKLAELGFDASDETLLVRRVVGAQSKSKVLINGALATVQTLRELVSPLIQLAGSTTPLIEMTGQHDNRNLLSKAYHLEILDQYAGVQGLKADYVKIFTEWQRTLQEIDELRRKAPEAEQRLDFLRFQREEIRDLDLQVGDEEILETRVKRARSQERLREFVALADHELSTGDDSVAAKIHAITQRLAELASVDESLGGKSEALLTAKSLIEDFVFDLRGYGRSLAASDDETEALESRLSKLRRVQKKFGQTAKEILQHLASLESEIETLENVESSLELLESRSQQLLLACRDTGEVLHAKRLKAAIPLADLINKELGELNMKGVEVSFALARLDLPQVTGWTDAELQVLTSKNDRPRPMAKIASGGELSRILLSIKRVIGSSDLPRTYLFDEVDAGVSGPTAEKVGRKLRSIARGSQVICVTHLPQVACAGETHYLIHKTVGSKSTQTLVERLTESTRVREIARLISGEKITKTSLDHAKQLLGL